MDIKLNYTANFLGNIFFEAENKLKEDLEQAVQELLAEFGGMSQFVQPGDKVFSEAEYAGRGGQSLFSNYSSIGSYYFWWFR